MEMERQRKMVRVLAQEVVEEYWRCNGYDINFLSNCEIEWFAEQYEKRVHKEWLAKREKGTDTDEEYITFAYNYIQKRKKYKKNGTLERRKKDIHRREESMLKTINGKKEKRQIRRVTKANLAAFERVCRRIATGWTDIYTLEYGEIEEFATDAKNIYRAKEKEELENKFFMLAEKIFGHEGAMFVFGRMKKLI